MAGSQTSDQLVSFLKTGIYHFENTNALFIDPVRVLNRSYTRFRVSPSAYYSRLFETKDNTECVVVPQSRKRKRKQKKVHVLNEKEKLSDRRHQEVRHLMLKAQEALYGASELLEVMLHLRNDGCRSADRGVSLLQDPEPSFLELGNVWQAPLYEITLKFPPASEAIQSPDSQIREQRVIPIFNNLIHNETSEEVEAEFMNSKFIVPRHSSFFMIHGLVPGEPVSGFNLILIDPPWENSSAHQKWKYPTLPNRYFLSLPIKKLAHTKGALVALWVTNREKLRCFVENELFPAWGVKYMATHYWLKVKSDGSLISELDLFHHRPYECLILGYHYGEELSLLVFRVSVVSTDNGILLNEQLNCDMDYRRMVDSDCLSSRFEAIPENDVLISVPGDYSRKPPVGETLLKYVPGGEPVRPIELFAREMIAGWTSWGNQPLHFQESRYFLK